MSNRDPTLSLIELLRCAPDDFGIRPSDTSASCTTTSITYQLVSPSSSGTSPSGPKDVACDGIAMVDMNREHLDQAVRDSGYDPTESWEADVSVSNS
jgi:hypothetical protein